MITIDGRFGEGGGQILRTSLSLAAITGQDVTIENIRKGRDKPGLRPQHLTAAMAVAQICGGELVGGNVDSRTLTFKPGKIRPGKYDLDISAVRSSAGSTNMVLQTILWPLAFGGKNSHVRIRGGTHNTHAPSSNYIDDIFLPAVADMGLRCNYSMVKAGYYPAGGGEIVVDIPSIEELKPICWTEPEKPHHVQLTSAVSRLSMSIAERQMNTASARLREMGLEFDQTLTEYPAGGPGTVVFMSLRTGRAGFQSLGELHKRAEKVADEACDELEQHLASGMAIDKHLADQLIIPMALAKQDVSGFEIPKHGFTTSEITQHLLTNIAVVEEFLPVRFQVNGELGQPGMVERVE